MTDDTADAAGDAFADRVAAIEALPLAERAAAYGELHDALTRALDVSAETP